MNTIVLHDNDEDLLDILSFVLREEGYIVHVTSTLDEHILELIADAKPYVVIIDYKLNGQDAIKACHLIRAFYPDLPIIATSCNSQIKDKYQSDGFDDYLDKPFNLATLVDLVRSTSVLYS
jgi:DNA-binding response OmpR family regulator